MKSPGQIYFDVEKPRHYLTIRIVSDSSRVICKGDLAHCDYNLGSSPKHLNRGELAFRQSYFTPSIIVHECVHAALNFAADMVMTGPKICKWSEKKRIDYYNELIPCLTESLFEQVYKFWEVSS